MLRGGGAPVSNQRVGLADKFSGSLLLSTLSAQASLTAQGTGLRDQQAAGDAGLKAQRSRQPGPLCGANHWRRLGDEGKAGIDQVV